MFIVTSFNTALVDKPIDSKGFHPYDVSVLPKLIFGFILNNKYDQERLQFKKIHQPKNILHFFGNEDELESIYLHGLELKPKSNIFHICKAIARAQPIALTGYKNILKYNGLSCDNCYGHFADGVYPIDIRHLGKVTNDISGDYEQLRNMLYQNKDLPWFSNWSQFKIFILLPSEIY